jgi:acetoin utilization deacetylase AcuC-like enzyme
LFIFTFLYLGLLAAVEAVANGEVDNAYALVRPPGHHALADKGMGLSNYLFIQSIDYTYLRDVDLGFCLFNNIVIAAKHLQTLGFSKIAIVDYDVHFGNGTQAAFYDDPSVLFICIHQDNNYPRNAGTIHETGSADAENLTINLPLPPGR